MSSAIDSLISSSSLLLVFLVLARHSQSEPCQVQTYLRHVSCLTQKQFLTVYVACSNYTKYFEIEVEYPMKHYLICLIGIDSEVIQDIASQSLFETH